jgi:amino acid transporter
MKRTRMGWVDILLGALFALCVVIILFIAPTDALYKNGMRMHLGDIFRGLEALIGTAGAKFLLAFPFGLFSFLILRRSISRPKPPRHKHNSLSRK